MKFHKWSIETGFYKIMMCKKPVRNKLYEP